MKTRRSGRVVPLPALCVRALRRRKADQAAERLAAGVHPRTVMSVLGHSQNAMTMDVYTHVTTEDQRTAVGLLGGLLDRVPGQEEVAHSRQMQPSVPDLEQLGGFEE